MIPAMKMRVLTAVMTALLTGVAMIAQPVIDPADYQIEKADIERAVKMMESPLKKAPVLPNPSKGAAWFPDASLGLFLHFGIHSPLGAQPSWNMIKDYRWGGKYNSPEKYYGQAETFNPEFDADRFLKAARDAGFTYAVMTARHHDGWALWPSKYGIGVKQSLPGRDLVREYVEACRRNGLKVGLYFSPRDWHYPGAMPASEWDSATRGRLPALEGAEKEASHEAFKVFFAYVLAQLEELLTNYGRIDVLWLDGMGWRGETEMYNGKVYAWIRSLQPDIVINDRWSNIVNPDDPSGSGSRYGDFTTPFECLTPFYKPSKWWEHCHIWTCGGGGWGYDRTGTFRPLDWFLGEFAASRAYGGNFLINVGPDGNGGMHPNYYKAIAEVQEWMEHSGEALLGAGESPGPELSNVLLTSRGKKIWYAHIFPNFKKEVSVYTVKKPKSVVYLRTREPVPHSYQDGVLTFKLREGLRTSGDDVVKIGL